MLRRIYAHTSCSFHLASVMNPSSPVMLFSLLVSFTTPLPISLLVISLSLTCILCHKHIFKMALERAKINWFPPSNFPIFYLWTAWGKPHLRWFSFFVSLSQSSQSVRRKIWIVMSCWNTFIRLMMSHGSGSWTPMSKLITSSATSFNCSRVSQVAVMSRRDQVPVRLGLRPGKARLLSSVWGGNADHWGHNLGTNMSHLTCTLRSKNIPMTEE